MNYAAKNGHVLHISEYYQKKPGEREFANRQESHLIRLNVPTSETSTRGNIFDVVAASGASVEEEVSLNEHWEILNEGVSSLSERERYIVEESARWFGTRTFRDIGYDLKISKQRVGQIENAIMAKLQCKIKPYMEKRNDE